MYNMWKGLILKNSKKVKLILALFFIFSLLIETVNRYYHRAALDFDFSWTEIELFILIVMIFLNPKGIKIIVSVVLLILIFFATQSVFFQHTSNIPRSLLLRDVFKRTEMDKSIIYIIHMIVYFNFLYLMFKMKNNSKLETELLDQ